MTPNPKHTLTPEGQSGAIRNAYRDHVLNKRLFDFHNDVFLGPGVDLSLDRARMEADND